MQAKPGRLSHTKEGRRCVLLFDFFHHCNVYFQRDELLFCDDTVNRALPLLHPPYFSTDPEVEAARDSLSSQSTAAEEQLLEVADTMFAHNTLQVYKLLQASLEDKIHFEPVGSGCLMSTDQIHVLTCMHVVDLSARYAVSYCDSKRVLVSVVATSTADDLAVLRLNEPIEGGDRPYFRLALPDGKHVSFCAGFRENSLRVTKGNIIASVNRIILTNITDHGASGGPATCSVLRGLIGIVKDNADAIAHIATGVIPSWKIYEFLKRNEKVVPQMEQV